jgi:hypothetical protein
LGVPLVKVLHGTNTHKYLGRLWKNI